MALFDKLGDMLEKTDLDDKLIDGILDKTDIDDKLLKKIMKSRSLQEYEGYMRKIVEAEQMLSRCLGKRAEK